MTKPIPNIQRLIDDLCPDGVEKKAIGEIGKLVRGSGLQKKDFVEQGVGCIHYGQIYTYYGTFTDKTKTFVSEELAQRLKKVNTGDLVIACTSENMEDVCKTVAWLGEGEIVTGGHSTIFKHNENPKYLAYYFQSREFFDQKKRYAKGAKVIDISAKDLAKINIPVPPLQIQEAIVDILDTFTTLEAELEAELEARRKQYEYYRDELLTHEHANGQWTTLGDVFTMTAGQHISASKISKVPTDDFPFPCYGGNGIRGFVTQHSHDGAYVLIGRQGALCGNVQRTKEKFYATEHAVVVTPIAEVDVNWAFHKLTMMNLNQYASKSAQPGLAVGRLKKVPIYLPVITEQQKISSTLDKFDALISDISIGLPAEIKARRQQYEYYRDKLLTFPEKACV